MNAAPKTASTRVTTGLALALLSTMAMSAAAAEPPLGASTPANAPRAPTAATAPGIAPTATSAPAGDAAIATPTAATEAEPSKVVCRTEKVTGSKLRTRKVCSKPDSDSKSADWVREQQARGAIGASAIPNSR